MTLGHRHTTGRALTMAERHLIIRPVTVCAADLRCVRDLRRTALGSHKGHSVDRRPLILPIVCFIDAEPSDISTSAFVGVDMMQNAESTP